MQINFQERFKGKTGQLGKLGEFQQSILPNIQQHQQQRLDNKIQSNKNLNPMNQMPIERQNYLKLLLLNDFPNIDQQNYKKFYTPQFNSRNVKFNDEQIQNYAKEGGIQNSNNCFKIQKNYMPKPNLGNKGYQRFINNSDLKNLPYANKIISNNSQLSALKKKNINHTSHASQKNIDIKQDYNKQNEQTPDIANQKVKLNFNMAKLKRPANMTTNRSYFYKNENIYKRPLNSADQLLIQSVQKHQNQALLENANIPKNNIMSQQIQNDMTNGKSQKPQKLLNDFISVNSNQQQSQPFSENASIQSYQSQQFEGIVKKGQQGMQLINNRAAKIVTIDELNEDSDFSNHIKYLNLMTQISDQKKEDQKIDFSYVGFDQQQH